jgi:hypothetical protein
VNRFGGGGSGLWLEERVECGRLVGGKGGGLLVVSNQRSGMPGVGDGDVGGGRRC